MRKVVRSPVYSPVLRPVVSASGRVQAPSFYADYVNGVYSVGGLSKTQAQAISFTRSGAAWADNLAGTWSSFATDTPRITNKGILIEPAGTNKSTTYSADPNLIADTAASSFGAAHAQGVYGYTAGTGTIAVIADTSAIASAGLSSIVPNSRVYRVTAGSQDTYIFFSGAVGNLNQHTISAFVRGTILGIGLDSNPYNLPGTYAAYTRLSAQVTPDTNSRVMFMGVAAGQTAYIILNQIEESARLTSPMVTAGATTTRNADALVLLLTAGTHDLVHTFDDNTTQTTADQAGGNYAVPTNLNRPWVKSQVWRDV